MLELSREFRDRAVWVLARLILATTLAVMAALLIGSAADGQTATNQTSSAEQRSESQRADVFEDADPLGLALGSLLVAVGIGVLAVGAARPRTRRDRHDLLR